MRLADYQLVIRICAAVSLAYTSAHAVHAAPTSCGVHSADGTGISDKAAKFQVYEGLLQSTDWGLWSQWMASGTTPGYKVMPVKFHCDKGTGLGVTCRGKTKICKL